MHDPQEFLWLHNPDGASLKSVRSVESCSVGRNTCNVHTEPGNHSGLVHGKLERGHRRMGGSQYAPFGTVAANDLAFSLLNSSGSVLQEGGKSSQNHARPIYCIQSPRLLFANRVDIS